MMYLLLQAVCERCEATEQFKIDFNRKSFKIDGHTVPSIGYTYLPDGWEEYKADYYDNERLLCPDCLKTAKDNRR